MSATPTLAPSATRSAAPATPSPTTTVKPAPTPEPTGLAKCATSQLQAVAAGVLTTDSFAGAVFIANRGTAPRTVRGNPQLAKDGSPLDIKLASVEAGTPTLVVLPVSQFQQDLAGVVGIAPARRCGGPTTATTCCR